MPLGRTIAELEQQQLLLEIEKMNRLQKAMVNGTPLDMLRASEELSKQQKGVDGDRRTYTFDPFNTSYNTGYTNAPTSLSLGFLRQMGRTPFVRSVIGTRQNQISRFSRPTVNPSELGWTIRKKRSLFDESSEPNDKEKREIEKLIEFIENCGTKDGDKYSQFSRHSFDTFLRETVNDSLSMDQLAFECVETRRGALNSFVSVDAETARYADQAKYYDENGVAYKQFVKNGQVPKYVQIYQNRPVSSFYSWEMCLGIRNKTTAINQNGYGISELEDLVKIVTWQLFGDQYNGKFFSNGAAPKGILKVAGNVNQTKLNEFRMYWQQMVTGVANAWRTPVLESDKIEWIDLQKSNQDMQFANWAEYLIRIICAMFKIDSTEVGFVFSSGNGGGGDPHTSHKQRTDYSKDKGLMPILTFYEELMNIWILPRLTDKYEFAWTGLSVEDEEQVLKNDVTQVTNWMTVNEMRAKKKMPPIKGGDIILNSVFIQGQQQMMGGQESNEFMDDEEGGQDDGTSDENPFDKSISGLNAWIANGMPNTMQQIKN